MNARIGSANPGGAGASAPVVDAVALSVLLVEDSPADARLVRAQLEGTGVTVVVVPTVEAAKQALVEPPACVLLDLNLPDATGLDAMRAVLDVAPTTPLVVLTGLDDEHLATLALAEGAQYYLVKDRVDRDVLLQAVRFAIERKRAEVAIAAQAAAEERFRALVESSSDLIALVDADARLLFANPAAERLLGFSPDGELGRNVLDFVDPADVARVAVAFDALRAAPGVDIADEFWVTTASGEGRVLETVSTNALDDPAVRGIIINGRDVTERRNLLRTLRTLSRCNQVLVHATDEDELLQQMCEAIVDTGGYLLAWVGYALHDDAHTVRPMAAAGAVDYVKDIRISWADDAHGRGPTGTAIRTGDVQILRDMATSPSFAPWREAAARHGFRTSMVLPLWVAGETIGAISIYAAEPGTFDATAGELLQELADDLAFGIAHLRASARLQRSLEGSIQAVAATIEIRDPYTAGHQRRVAQLAATLAERIGLTPDAVQGIRVAASMHDIGKIYVPSEILTRPGGLTPVEFELVKVHAQVGADIVKSIEFPWPVADMIRQHHERLDGSGYPLGLAGDEIPIGSRILAVADVVEAISHFRPYRPGLGLEAAFAELKAGRGERFDEGVVDTCLALFAEGTFDWGS